MVMVELIMVLLEMVRCIFGEMVGLMISLYIGSIWEFGYRLIWDGWEMIMFLEFVLRILMEM